MTVITGNTYPVRYALRRIGGYPRKQQDGSWVWVVPNRAVAKAAKLIAQVTGPKPWTYTHCTYCAARATRKRTVCDKGICSECYANEGF